MIYEKVVADYNAARKNRETHIVNLLSPLIGDAQTKAKNDGVESLNDAAMTALIQSHIKNLKITLNALYDNGGSAEQTAAAQYDIVNLNIYLPKQLDETEIRSIITSLNAANMGAVMTHFKTNYAGQYDGKALSTIAKEMV